MLPRSSCGSFASVEAWHQIDSEVCDATRSIYGPTSSGIPGWGAPAGRRRIGRTGSQRGKIERKPKKSAGIGVNWLGGRDSNPDNVVQRLTQTLHSHGLTAIFRTHLEHIDTQDDALNGRFRTNSHTPTRSTLRDVVSLGPASVPRRARFRLGHSRNCRRQRVTPRGRFCKSQWSDSTPA